jgi:hypothetical protein
MTIKRAIDVLKHGCIYRDALGSEAISMAIEILEKRLPKKPKTLIIDKTSGVKAGNCVCGEHIMDDEKYCSNCGQAIDWSDVE